MNILYSVFWLACVAALKESDDLPGFEEWFTSNNLTYNNYPIEFDKPFPDWIHGTLIRNGPGQFESGNHYFQHAFDGFAKLMSVKFSSNGSAYFSTKMLQTKFFTSSFKEKNISPYFTFDPIRPPRDGLQNIEAVMNGFDNTNVNIYNFSDNNGILNAINDEWYLYQFNLTSLNTIQYVVPPLPKSNHSVDIGRFRFLSSAHPLPEYNKKSHITILSFYGLLPEIKSTIAVVRIKSTYQREIIAELPVDDIPYMHSFSVTPNYVILHAPPIFTSLEDAMRYGNAANSMKWNTKKNAKIYAIRLSDGKVSSFETSPKLLMHHINAFEESESKIVFDGPAFSSLKTLHNLDISTLKNASKRHMAVNDVTLIRYILDIDHGTVSNITYKDDPNGIPVVSTLGIPTINENYRSRSYCFVYGLVYKVDNKDLGQIALAKKDLCKQGRDKLLLFHHHYPSEAWFVSPPNKSADEDDGYLMSVIMDGDAKRSYVALIDAKSMIITHKAYFPTYVPFTIHGRFFPGVL